MSRCRMRQDETGASRSNDRTEIEDALQYIAEMTAQLASLAGETRLPMLTYFLNMARVEAEMQIHERIAPTVFAKTTRGR